MSLNVSDTEGAQALDFNQFLRSITTGVLDGCSTSVGTNAMEVDVASGSVAVEAQRVEVAATTVTLDAANVDYPRKDVIFVDSSGAVQVAKGTAEPAEPSGETRWTTNRPAPPDLAEVTGAVLAEVWVPAGASDIVADDTRDRRAETTDSGVFLTYNETEDRLEATIPFNTDEHRVDEREEHGLTTVSSATTTDGTSPYWKVDSSGGAVTISLGSTDAVDGRELNVKREGGNNVTIDTEGSETIEGESSIELTNDQESVTLVYNNPDSDWEVW